MILSFDDCEIDLERRELSRAGIAVHVEPQVFDLLAYLAQNGDRVVSKDEIFASIWEGRIVSDSTLTSRINAARRAVGDTGKEQRLIRTVARKGIRFIGEVGEQAKSAAKAPPPGLRHEIHFCTASDGARIAYAEVGEGPPLLKA